MYMWAQNGCHARFPRENTLQDPMSCRCSRSKRDSSVLYSFIAMHHTFTNTNTMEQLFHAIEDDGVFPRLGFGLRGALLDDGQLHSGGPTGKAEAGKTKRKKEKIEKGEEKGQKEKEKGSCAEKGRQKQKKVKKREEKAKKEKAPLLQ
ncbi:unnamed protein product [Amoebophrya sp. A120]|nr:unnamed protein product [Amoebophrya sp. A120]|eukprot:GSA120T00015408001.1